MKKLLFVYNPYAGKGLIKNKIADIISIFTRKDYLVTAYPTQRALDGYDKVCAADGMYDMIVCSGGDGTLNEIISAVMCHKEKRPEIGYIPAGTTNDFATTLKIPRNMIKAAENIADGTAFPCDIGKMNGRYFTYVAAFGLFTEVSYNTPQKMKNIFGHQAYVLESIKSLSNIKAYNLVITCDERVIKGCYIYGMVANSKSVGGFKGLTGKDVELDDGLFEVALVKKPENAIELQQIVAGVLNNKYESQMLERFKTDHIIIESEESMAWTIDGENADEHQHVEIIVRRKAFDIVIS